MEHTCLPYLLPNTHRLTEDGINGAKKAAKIAKVWN